MSSCTSFNDLSPLTSYAANPSSTRITEDQRKRYVRGGAAWIQEATFSSKDYGKARLTPSWTSDLEIMTQILTSMRQCISYCIVGRRKTRIRTVINVTRNVNIFLCVCSQCMEFLVRSL